MPRPGPRRPGIGIRLGDEQLARIDAIAEAESVSRSDVVRAMIAMGLRAPAAELRRAIKREGEE